LNNVREDAVLIQNAHPSIIYHSVLYGRKVMQQTMAKILLIALSRTEKTSMYLMNQSKFNNTNKNLGCAKLTKENFQRSHQKLIMGNLRPVNLDAID